MLSQFYKMTEMVSVHDLPTSLTDRSGCFGVWSAFTFFSGGPKTEKVIMSHLSRMTALSGITRMCPNLYLYFIWMTHLQGDWGTAFSSLCVSSGTNFLNSVPEKQIISLLLLRQKCIVQNRQGWVLPGFRKKSCTIYTSDSAVVVPSSGRNCKKKQSFLISKIF